MPKTSPSISAATTTKAAAAIAISLTEVLLPSALFAAAPPDLPDLADLTEPLFAAEAAAAVSFLGSLSVFFSAGFLAAGLLATAVLDCAPVAAGLDCALADGFCAALCAGVLTAVRAWGCFKTRSLGLCGAVAGLAAAEGFFAAVVLAVVAGFFAAVVLAVVAGFFAAVELAVVAGFFAAVVLAVVAGFFAAGVLAAVAGFLDADAIGLYVLSAVAGFLADGAAVGLTVERFDGAVLSSDLLSAILTSPRVLF